MQFIVVAEAGVAATVIGTAAKIPATAIGTALRIRIASPEVIGCDIWLDVPDPVVVPSFTVASARLQPSTHSANTRGAPSSWRT